MTSENAMYMPVAPAYMNGGDMFGNNGAQWIIILLAIFWGGNGWNGNGNGNVNADLQRGFDQATLTNGLTNVQNAICNGFAGVNQGICNGFANAEIAANSRQMASMNQNFGLQQGIGNLQYAIATEACADRNAISMALRDVLEANNASTQRILDTMCQDKIDAKNELIANLRQQLQMAQLSASQNAQTAQIIANNDAQTYALEQYLAPVPKPAYIVQNPNCCAQNMACGCGAA